MTRERILQAVVVAAMIAGVGVFVFAEDSMARIAGVAGAVILGISLFLPGRYSE